MGVWGFFYRKFCTSESKPLHLNKNKWKEPFQFPVRLNEWSTCIYFATFTVLYFNLSFNWMDLKKNNNVKHQHFYLSVTAIVAVRLLWLFSWPWLHAANPKSPYAFPYNCHKLLYVRNSGTAISINNEIIHPVKWRLVSFSAWWFWEIFISVRLLFPLPLMIW